MASSGDIRPGMGVITPDGRRIGRVDEADMFGLKLAADSTADGRHHYVARDLIGRVDAEAVHLNQRAQRILSGARGDGRSRGAGGDIAAWAGGDAQRLIPWLLAALLALVVLVLLFQDRDRDAATAPAAEGAGVAAPAAPAAQQVALPDGETVEAAPGSLAANLQGFLASREAAPQSFLFDQLRFDTGSAEIGRAYREEIDTVAQVLAAYPEARVRVVGYTDASGGELPNRRLAYARARGVAEALADRSVDEDRIEAISGGEDDPLASNETAQGRAANRRTKLIVLSR